MAFVGTIDHYSIVVSRIIYYLKLHFALPTRCMGGLDYELNDTRHHENIVK